MKPPNKSLQIFIFNLFSNKSLHFNFGCIMFVQHLTETKYETQKIPPDSPGHRSAGLSSYPVRHYQSIKLTSYGASH